MEWGLYNQDTIFGGGDGGSCSSKIVLTVSLIGRNFAFQNGLGLTIKPPLTLRKQPKTANTNSHGRKGLLSDGFLRLRFAGLIFGRAYFWMGLLSEFYGNLRVSLVKESFTTGGGGGKQGLGPRNDVLTTCKAIR